MIRFVVSAICLLAATTVTGCTRERQIREKNLIVTYTSSVDDVDAMVVAQHLSQQWKIGVSKPAAVRIDRIGGKYQVQMAVTDDYRTELNSFRAIATAVSVEAFSGRPMEFHLTDRYFKTRMVIVPTKEMQSAWTSLRNFAAGAH